MKVTRGVCFFRNRRKPCSMTNVLAIQHFGHLACLMDFRSVSRMTHKVLPSEF